MSQPHGSLGMIHYPDLRIPLCPNSTLMALFQITNQMITACKSYITEWGRETVWSQPRDEVLKKLRDCIKLNEEYQGNFHKTKVPKYQDNESSSTSTRPKVPSVKIQ